MNTRTITFKKIRELFEEIANAHVEINSFYRFNISEVNNALRSGLIPPVLMMEGPSTSLYQSPNNATTFNLRDISCLVMDSGGSIDDYAKQDDVLNNLEGVALDIVQILNKYSKQEGHWLYGLFDVATVRIEKAGPLFDNMFGWNILFELRNKETMVLDQAKWNMPV